MQLTTDVEQTRYYEVEIQFLAPTGAVVPITAKSEAEAREIALYLFREHNNLQVTKITDITEEPAQPLLN